MLDDGRGWTAEPAEHGLPPVGDAFARRWRDVYRAVLLPDGMPGRLAGDRAVPHPMYAVYLVREYLRLAAGGDHAYADAALNVSRSALRRMEPHEDGLVLWYEPVWELSSWVSERHYSALTQSSYAHVFAQVASLTRDEELAAGARAVFRSLLVPSEAGGVLVTPSGGLGFEEVPTRPTSLVLNGWQSTLVNIWSYADVVGDDEARDLVQSSARTMAELLPLYDVPELLTSRYSLAGYLHARLLFDAPGVGVHDVTVHAPDDGSWHLSPGEPGRDSRWKQFWFHQDRGSGEALPGRQLRLNVVLTRLGYPQPNLLSLTAASPGAQLCRLEVRTGRYSPLSSSPVDLEWREASTARLLPGRQTVTLPVHWPHVPLIGYPTNFLKRIEGVQRNVYHDLHCTRLSQLADITGRADLAEWARLWRGYGEQWEGSPVYAELGHGVSSDE